MFSQHESKTSSIQIPLTRTIFSTVLVLVTIAFTLNLFFIFYQNKVLFNSKLDSFDDQVQETFHQSIAGLNEKFAFLITHYTQMGVITDAIEANDREALFNSIKDDYYNLRKQEPNLFVMHFFDTKNKTILRMHKPESFGDDLTHIRPIVAYVNRTQKQVTGFEVGKNGITYRITTPIYNRKQEHIGVLEFGIKPEYFEKILKQNYKVFTRTLVKTKSLDKLTYNTDFDTVENYSILNNEPLFKDLNLKVNQPNQVIDFQDKTYLSISNISLQTFDGKDLVKIQVIKDISDFSRDYNNNNKLYIAFSFAAYAFFILFLFLIFQRYHSRLIEAVNQLDSSEKQRQKITNISQKDELTRAFNRRYFNSVITELFTLQTLENQDYSVIFFDIDHFKYINDEQGHLIGDEVLKALADLVRSHFRSADMLFRWGGEEFFLLLPNTSLEVAIEIAERFREEVENHAWPKALKVTISSGVIQIDASESPLTMQHRLDNLLYKAKSSGRNCVVSQ